MSPNQQQFTTSQQLFEYQDEFVIESIAPRQGSVGGSTLVSIAGSVISQRVLSLGLLRCRFDTAVVAAFYVNEVVQCTTAPHAAGLASVEVSLRSSHDPHQLSYVHMHSVHT